jgi:hypothetical protein
MEICPETRSKEYNYTPHISRWGIYYVTEVQFKSFWAELCNCRIWDNSGLDETSNKCEHDIQRVYRRLIKLCSSINTQLAVFKTLRDCCEEMYIHFCFHFTAVSSLHQELL